ncbi:MAG: DUF255 domain-containing protein [Planctomycetes bacterium]|nr:DUF255 domain-containing protein [Planctomycetota bacterium]
MKPLIAALLCLAPTLMAQEGKQRPDIYDPNADGIALVDAAQTKAARDNQRVLVMIGGNWCGWCHWLHDTFQKDRAIATVLRNEYQLVMLDSKAKGFEELKARWKSPVTSYPYLVVLAADGTVVRNQHTEPLEKDKGHDPAKVLAFLKECQAEPLDARKVLASTLAEGAKSGRAVFVHIGAPWCGWCHRLEDFLARPEIAAILAKDLVDVKIDQDRMTHGKEVAATLRAGRGSGIPWSVFLTGDGKEVATSDAKGPGEGNIGFPVQPGEIAHFLTMLAKVRHHMTDGDLEAIREALKKSAEEIEAARKKARGENG